MWAKIVLEVNLSLVIGLKLTQTSLNKKKINKKTTVGRLCNCVPAAMAISSSVSIFCTVYAECLYLHILYVQDCRPSLSNPPGTPYPFIHFAVLTVTSIVDRPHHGCYHQVREQSLEGNTIISPLLFIYFSVPDCLISGLLTLIYAIPFHHHTYIIIQPGRCRHFWIKMVHHTSNIILWVI